MDFLNFFTFLFFYSSFFLFRSLPLLLYHPSTSSRS